MAATEKNQTEIEKAKQLNYIPWCDEYEKMISGMLYDSFIPELEASRFKARAWCHKYNNWFPQNDPKADFRHLIEARSEMLKEILGSVGAETLIEPPFTFDYGCNIKVGERFYANFNCCILDCGLVEIGDRTFFGPGVGIYAATHEVDVQSRRDNIEFAKPVRIGADCWIGANAVILPGVTIGKGCTIGASSVVTRDIPDWSVAMGSPARVVKQVTPVEDIPSEASS
ncbi:hypothetical protein OHC33_004935 [Knufia fluminis]|uniref:Maltose/galactoside acetyltransferase domain-containing protein n=1 Tax=Knufia fluminis TaxID=191047 RepID=A0AAN8EWE4_9EURO|nr:hypothetical protein OHC33_004935 [Knufia fluminis]